jgi:hypothetical protein
MNKYIAKMRIKVLKKEKKRLDNEITQLRNFIKKENNE